MLIKKINNKLKLSSLEKTNRYFRFKNSRNREKTNKIFDIDVEYISLFNLIKPNNNKIMVLIDDSIKNNKIVFHTLQNDITVTLLYLDMIKLIESCGNYCQIVKI